MAWDLKKEEDVKEYLKNLEIEYTFGCHSEKKPEVCHALGDYYEAVKKDFPKSAPIYKTNCDDYNYGRSCMSYGAYAFVGRGIPKQNVDEAYYYFKKACDLNVADGCFNTGLMHTTGSDVLPSHFKDYRKGIPFLQKACELNSEHGCYYLSCLYLSGSNDKSVAKDMEKAFKLSEKACNLKNMYACVNMSIMYKKGQGVEQNLELAEKYKQRAVEMQQELKDTMTLSFGRDKNS